MAGKSKVAAAKEAVVKATESQVAQSDGALVLLKAVEPIRHNGTFVSPGEMFAVEVGAVPALLDGGAAEIADGE